MALELAAIDPRVMVKVPINITGILLANQLIDEGANVTLTALHFAQQVVTAVAMGAKYAAPYLGRITDGGLNGLEEVTTMGQIIREMNSPLRLARGQHPPERRLGHPGRQGIEHLYVNTENYSRTPRK